MNDLVSDKEIFSSEYSKANLKSRSVRGGLVTFTTQGITFFLGFLSTVVLARLLVPEDFGLIAMVTAVTRFITIFKDMGLSMATVQKENINHAQVSTLFWINLSLSLAIMLLVTALAPVIALFYNQARLTWITVSLASTFVFSGLTIQHQALLRRQMRFGSLALTQIISISIGILAAIVSALYGMGYWALVIKQLVESLTNMLAVWVACKWRPGKPVWRSGVRSMLSFGGNLTGFNLLNYFARNADNLLIGRFWGSVQLGLYAKAYGLLMLPIRQVTAPIAAVAIPALSRLQDDPVNYQRYYYRALRAIAFVTMPTIAMLAALSEEVIEIVLGNRWIGAAAIFKVLAFAALLQPVVNPVGWVFVSLGQTDRQLRWALFAAPITVISFIIGLPWGAYGIAFSYMICNLTVLAFPALWWSFRFSPINIKGWLEAIYRPLIISLVVYCVAELFRRFVICESILVVLGSVISALVCCSIILLFWRRARQEVLDTIHILRLLKDGDQRDSKI